MLCVAFLREAWDEFCRYRQDKNINDELFTKITFDDVTNEAKQEKIKSSNIKIGDLIILNENQRVPADMILIWCSSNNGTTFVRTDQLDGETD